MAIQTLNTIKSWFQTGLKPSQKQFWETWDSFRHKFEKVPVTDIEGLESVLDSKVDKSQLNAHENDQNGHAELFAVKEDKSQKGAAGGYVPLDEFSKIATKYLNIINNLTSGGSTSLLAAEQGVVLQNQINAVNVLLASDNLNLDTIQKIVNTIEQIQMSLEDIFVNDLTTGGSTKALTAEMGKLLETNKEDKSQKGVAGGYVPLDSMVKIANNYLNIVNDLVTGGADSLLSAEQGKYLQNQINGINTLLSSDNINLDTIQEIVDAIEEVQISLNTILINDLSTGGITKALTAEMGKQLNLIKLTGSLATDSETQITQAVNEDDKVVSRSKLFNWWEWVKKQSQTISAVWYFKKGINVNNSTGNYVYTTQMLEDMFISQLNTAGYGNFKVQYGWETIKWFATNGYYTQLIPYSSPTQNNSLRWPNKSGTVALINDYVTTAPGTATTPPLIIPNGTLTTIPQNGAIEANSSGIFYTVGGVRKSLITEYVIDYSNMDKYIYLTGNGTAGIREEYVTLVSDSTLFNDFTSNQFGKYRISLSGIISRIYTAISDIKFELQMLISNSGTPSTWYTVSVFADSRSNIIATSHLPVQVSLSAELLLEDIGSKYIYITGSSSDARSESFFKSVTPDLKTSISIPKRSDMLVSFRIKATVNWTQESATQDLLAKFGLTKMLKI